MKPEDFVSAVRRVWLANALDRYKRILTDTPRNPAADTVWQKQILPCWDTLDDRQRDGVLKFVRLAMVETISDMFVLVDNLGGFNEFRDKFHLVYGDECERVSGDLLDYFLAAEEDDPAEIKWQS